MTVRDTEVVRQARERLRAVAREKDSAGSGVCMCGGDANSLYAHDGHMIVEVTRGQMEPCDETLILDAFEAIEYMLLVEDVEERLGGTFEKFHDGWTFLIEATRSLMASISDETITLTRQSLDSEWCQTTKVEIHEKELVISVMLSSEALSYLEQRAEERKR